MSRKGIIIVIVAPSGTGKSTLIERLKNDIPRLEWSVSYTTRPKRTGEVHGKDYFFIEESQFKAMIEREEFVEWAKVHSNYYGTSKSFVRQGLELGKTLLFDLDVQGCDEIKKEFKEDSHVIFIEPPSIEELEKRLRGRATDSNETIELRVSNAKSELLRKNDYDSLVMNDEVERAYQELKNLVNKLIGELDD